MATYEVTLKDGRVFQVETAEPITSTPPPAASSSPAPAPSPLPDNYLTKNSTPLGRKLIGAAAKVGNFLGMGEFGTGIADAGREISGANKSLYDTANSEQKINASVPAATIQRLKRQGKPLPGQTGTEIAPNLTDITTDNLSNKQVLGSAAMTAANALSGGSLAGAADTASGRIATGAIFGTVTGGAQGLRGNKDAKGIVTDALTGGLVGGGLSGVFEGGVALVKKLSTADGAGRVVNSLIKPLSKDLAYGKNPGRAVAQEHITANSLDELAAKIADRRQQIGSQISERINAPELSGVTVDLTNVTAPIDEAIAQARRNPNTNAALISRLEGVKKDLLGAVTDASGEVVQTKQLKDISLNKAFEVKQDIADITKFTGNASDDNTVNRALKRAYGMVKETMNDHVPGLKGLNERYADLSSAEVATKYRDVIQQRQAIISLKGHIGAVAAPVIAFLSGANPIEALTSSAVGALADKVAGSPAVKTRIASLLASSDPARVADLLAAHPNLAGALSSTVQTLTRQATSQASRIPSAVTK